MKANRAKENFDSLIKNNLQVFQNHRKQAKINIVFHFFSSLGIDIIQQIADALEKVCN